MRILLCKIKNIIQWCFATLPRKIVSCLVIAGILISSAWYLFLKPQPVEASWWDEDWLYRRAVPISTHTSEETDVYIEITNIDTSDTDKFQTDCGDIRFTKLDGTVLDYYIVSGCGTSSTTVHVYYDTFPAGAQTIYLYYGNPSIDNGYEGTDFTTEASSYSLGSIGSEETGTGPVLWLKFDEGYGNTAYDATEQGNNGTITNASWTDFGKFGKALSFDGTNDHVNMWDSDEFSFTDGAGNDKPFSVSFWFNTADCNPQQELVSKYSYDGNYREWRITISSDILSIRSFHFDNASIYIGRQTANNIDDLENTWVHVVTTYDGSEASSGFKIYVNGLQVDEADYKNSVYSGMSNTSAHLRIGERADGTTDYTGKIDEVKIYPYARTEAQVKRDYNQGAAARIGGDESWITEGLVGHWKMDEDSWDTTPNQVIDSSGAGNHGTSADNATTTGTAKFGRAGTFDGNGDYVTLSPPVTEAPFTICAWVNLDQLPSDFGDEFTIVGITNNFTSDFFVLRADDADGTVRFNARAEDGTTQSARTTTTVTAGVWEFYCGVATSATDRKVYLNAGNIGTNINSVAPVGLNTANIGALDLGTPDDETDGLIDDVRIYNRALSSFEVRRLYEWGPPPIAHWTFDEGSGSSVYDSSENENTGTLQDDTTWKSAADCKFGNCLEFDGANDYVEVLANSSLEGFSAFTLMAWVSPTGDHGGDYGRIISKTQGASNDDYALSQRSDTDKFVFRVNTDVDRTTMRSDTAAVPNSGWWHVAATWNTDGDMEIFVNGFSDGTNSQTGTLDDSNEHMGIGGHPDSATRRFNGMIDDVKIYNYALSPKQIAELYSQGSVGHSEAAVGYWKFDEGHGATAQDSSGRDNDLSFSGSTESYTMSGKFGRAWDGDGSKYLYRADDDDFDFTATQDFSATMWFKSDSADNPSANEFLLSKYSEAGYGIYANKDGNIVFGIDDDASWTPDDRAGPGVNKDFYDNTWHHVSVVKVATSSIETFIDGRSIGKDSSLSATGTLANSASLYIGDKDGSDNGDEFNGNIDEVKIYRFALSPEEILLDYNKGKSVMMGAIGTESDGTTPSWSQTRAYCPPGFTGTCDPPVGEWKMNEAEDNTCAGTNDVCDTSSNANDGAINGDPEWKGPGDCKYGFCLDFDGNGDYVDVGDIDATDGIDYLTVSAWVKPNSLTNDFAVVNKYDTTIGDGWVMGAMPGDNDDVLLGVTNDGNDYCKTELNLLAAGVWNHWVMTYNGNEALSEDRLNFYFNGVSKAVSCAGTILTSTPSTSASVLIGAIDGPAREINGTIDDVKIFDYAMTQEQIAWLYNKGKPIAHWKFDEGEGDTAYDSGENTNHGTLENGATWTSSGRFNSALSLDGIDDYVEIANESNFDLAGAMSASAWIWLDDTSQQNWAGIVSKNANASVSGWEFSLNNLSQKKPRFFVRSSTGYNQVTSPDALGAQQWYHIVSTFDGTDVKIYVDGVEKDSTVFSGTQLFNDNQPQIGRELDDGAEFGGYIDEVKIYNYALTEEQIKMDYNQGSALRFGD